MFRFFRLQIPSNKRNDKYTQGILVNSAIVGTKHAVGETRERLIILEGGGYGPSYEESYFGPLIPGQIQRITIKVPDEPTPIEVDVVLTGYTGNITVEALMNKYSYRDIKVYSINEVTIYD